MAIPLLTMMQSLIVTALVVLSAKAVWAYRVSVQETSRLPVDEMDIPSQSLDTGLPLLPGEAPHAVSSLIEVRMTGFPELPEVCSPPSTFMTAFA